jgi:hypothetical protein
LPNKQNFYKKVTHSKKNPHHYLVCGVDFCDLACVAHRRITSCVS